VRDAKECISLFGNTEDSFIVIIVIEEDSKKECQIKSNLI